MTLSSSALESLMPHYAALDVSNDETAIHILDEAGRTVWRGKRPSDPEALATALRRYAPELVRVGLETGFLTPWLYPPPPLGNLLQLAPLVLDRLPGRRDPEVDRRPLPPVCHFARPHCVRG